MLIGERRMSIPRDVIVIGASKGSLPALQRLLGGLSASLPAAILIVLHVSLDALRLHLMLDQANRLPLIYVCENQALCTGHVHLAAPGMEMVIRTFGCLGVDSAPMGRARRSAIDRLFKSAAKTLGYRVIAVLLSGSDSAGTQGLKEIEQADGIGIVQEPKEAAVSEMPRYAIGHDKPHYIAPVEGIAELLMTLTQKNNLFDSD